MRTGTNAGASAASIRLLQYQSRDSRIPASRANAAADFPLAFHRVISFAISRRFASRLPTVTSGPPSFWHQDDREKDGVRRTFTPISQIAPCSPETSDSKLSVKHTPAHSQFEYGSTKW